VLILAGDRVAVGQKQSDEVTGEDPLLARFNNPHGERDQ